MTVAEIAEHDLGDRSVRARSESMPKCSESPVQRPLRDEERSGGRSDGRAVGQEFKRFAELGVAFDFRCREFADVAPEPRNFAQEGGEVICSQRRTRGNRERGTSHGREQRQLQVVVVLQCRADNDLGVQLPWPGAARQVCIPLAYA